MFKLLIAVLVIVILVVGAGYLVLEKQHAADVEQTRQAGAAALLAYQRSAEALGNELALDTTRVLAAAAAIHVEREEKDELNRLLASSVQGNRLVAAIVLDTEGKVIAATDMRFHHRVLDDAATLKALATQAPTITETAPNPDQTEIDAPLLVGETNLGALRTFYELTVPLEQ